MRRRPGYRNCCERSAARLCHMVVCRYVVPDFGTPTWKNTRRAIPGLRPAASLQRTRVAFEGFAHLLLVALLDRDQQLLHDVHQLGEPSIEPPVLLDLLLELRHT